MKLLIVEKLVGNLRRRQKNTVFFLLYIYTVYAAFIHKSGLWSNNTVDSPRSRLFPIMLRLLVIISVLLLCDEAQRTGWMLYWASCCVSTHVNNQILYIVGELQISREVLHSNRSLGKRAGHLWYNYISNRSTDLQLTYRKNNLLSNCCKLQWGFYLAMKSTFCLSLVYVL